MKKKMTCQAEIKMEFLRQTDKPYITGSIFKHCQCNSKRVLADRQHSCKFYNLWNEQIDLYTNDNVLVHFLYLVRLFLIFNLRF